MGGRSEVQGESFLSLALAAVSALVAVTCSALGPGTQPVAFSAAPSDARGVTLQQSPVRSDTGPSVLPSASGSGRSVEPSLPRPFPRLENALARLAQGGKAPVRIAWFGDSHSAADFMPDVVRKRLQAQFGNGGPGFVRLGIQPYRHSQVVPQREGRWRREPSPQAGVERYEDGIFGIAGLRGVPLSRNAEVSLRLRESSVRGEASWDLLFRATQPASGFLMMVDDQAPERVGGAPGTLGAIQHIYRRGRAEGSLALRGFSSSPELLGVYVESSEPGVVLDTLAIDGARARTPLAWDGPTFIQELKARNPSLVVLAYGTNEAFGGDSLTTLPDYWRTLLTRTRSGAPDADCLIVGPTDAPEADGTSKPRVLQVDEIERGLARELGCTYFSMIDGMGGPGGFSRWRQASPPLGAEDGIHLTRQGYELIGSAIADWLLAGFLSP